MLDHGVALALLEDWMRKINRITAGSRVLLYGNEVGIVALGVATPERKDGILDGDPMRFVKLGDFKKLIKPMAPSEVRRVGGQGFVFGPSRDPEGAGEPLLPHATHTATST